MPTDSALKVGADHLRRDAFLYVRQSSLRQVFENTESTKRQYALRERAVALGWPIERVHVIDSDLGLSGAQARDRDGFQHLVTEVGAGPCRHRAGAGGLAAGAQQRRLASAARDWRRMSRTLILDEDGVYDPAHFNDRLLLGLKGTMSEAELHILKSRLQGGILNKARRGELEMPLPVGLVYDVPSRVVLDPDRQIQDTVRLLFDTFRETGSACAVVRRMRAQKVLFPRRIRRGIGKGDLLWGALDHSRVLQILHNPRYAGAFVYGRTHGAYNAELKHVQRAVKQEDWQVLIRDAHAGYISWEEFERNQHHAAAKRRRVLPRLARGHAARGQRLAAGTSAVRQVRRAHAGALREPARVSCNRTTAATRRSCATPASRASGFTGVAIDEAIGALLLETVAPAAIEVALAVQQEIAQRVEQAAALRQAQLQRARYEAELARRRYAKVDPDNRLVADALEADWNERLRQLDALQRDHERQQQREQALLDEPARQRIIELARDFPRVWNDSRTSAVERKRMLALLIEDVTLVAGPSITVHVRWRGGRTQTLFVDKPRPIARIRKTLAGGGQAHRRTARDHRPTRRSPHDSTSSVTATGAASPSR